MYRIVPKEWGGNRTCTGYGWTREIKEMLHLFWLLLLQHHFPELKTNFRSQTFFLINVFMKKIPQIDYTHQNFQSRKWLLAMFYGNFVLYVQDSLRTFNVLKEQKDLPRKYSRKVTQDWRETVVEEVKLPRYRKTSDSGLHWVKMEK